MNRTVNKIERKFFGNDKKAWMIVEITHDARMAFLRELCLGGDASLGKAEVIAVLGKDYHIIEGIDETVIERVLQEVVVEPTRTFNSRIDVIVARETPPVLARNGRVDYLFLDGVVQDRLPYTDLKAAFTSLSLAGVLARNLPVRAVAPGEAIAELRPARQAKPGRDIYGRIVSPVVGGSARPAQLLAGKNVSVARDRFEATLYGYVCVIEGEISVIPPVWISRNGFEAHFIHFEQVGQVVLPTKEWLEQDLEAVGVGRKLSADTADELLAHLSGLESQKGSFLLVQGEPAVPGGDAEVTCHFDLGPDLLLPDGSIDVTARKTALGVKSRQLLIEVSPPTAGRPGVDLYGKPLPAPGGEIRAFKVGKNVYVEGEPGAVQRYYAKFDGNVQFNGTTVEVHPVLRIGGDVDANTGHIDAPQDVEITGSVRAGMKVSAAGSITVGGVVEAGASLTARGDVVVVEGILGSATKVVALGHLTTKRIEQGSVFVRRNIVVGDCILNAHIRAGGRVDVGSALTEGRIAGGDVYAGTGMEVGTVGTSEGSQTVVGINSDVEIETQLKKLRDSVGFCDANIMRIFRTLDIQSLDPELLQGLLRRTPPGRKKEAITSLLVKLRELVLHRDRALKNQKALQAQIVRKLEDAEIRVRDIAHADVQVRIGDLQRSVPEDLNAPVFFASLNGIKWQQEA